jgi:methionyl-tRNA synthetase
VYWPAMLMSAGIEPPAKWIVHGWLLVGGEKMSKTSLNQIVPAELVDDFGLDGFRYHMLADNPVGPDSDFTYENMVTRYNADLANNLGNLVSRVTTVVHKGCAGVGPAPQLDSPLASAANTAVAAASAAWTAIAPSDALSATWGLLRATNAYLEQHEPWKMEPGPELDAVMGDALEVIRIAAVLIAPAIPSTAQLIWDRLGLPGLVLDQAVPSALVWGGYPGGLAVIKGEPLFPRRAKAA